MNRDRQQIVQDALVFALLIAIGVAGRWSQPQWCFTPTAAAAIFAGCYFSRAAIAAMVPLAILLISDLALPAHNSAPVMIATYGVMATAVLLGRLLRGKHAMWSWVGRWAMCSFMPATLFFLVTNFAVWAFQSDYAKTPAGLVECYLRAVPFYRWMLAGDAFYLALLFACAALVGVRFVGQARVAE